MQDFYKCYFTIVKVRTLNRLSNLNKVLKICTEECIVVI